MISTHDCEAYLRETLASVLIQDPGPERMQIDVVDDASSDQPESVVEELGRGRAGFYRQPRNVGHVANFNTCLERSRGRLVHSRPKGLGEDWEMWVRIAARYASPRVLAEAAAVVAARYALTLRRRPGA